MDIGIVYHIENAHQFWDGMSALLLIVAVLIGHLASRAQRHLVRLAYGEPVAN